MENGKEAGDNRICIGIDLGTTNTTAAYMAPGRASPIDLDIMQKNNGISRSMKLMPSILYLKPDGEEVVGFEAEDLKENSIVREQDKLRYLENTKRFMGTQRTFTIDDKAYTPIDVATAILEHVKKYSQINRIKGEFQTIITVPANFRNDQRNATLEAARRAGFVDNVELYDEPKAAILSFLHEDSLRLDGRQLDLSEKKTILVIDIGGGTCDICVVDVEQNGEQPVFTNRAVGREDLGGVDFDVRIGDELAKKYLHDVQLTDADVATLRTVGQKIKEQISLEIDNYLCEPPYFGDDSALYKKADWSDILESEDISYQIAREVHGEMIHFNMGVREFANTISALIYKTTESVASNKDEREQNKNMEALIDTTLQDFDVSIDDVDFIFLTGGMAKCFPLKAALFEVYQKPIICPADPLLAVSRGASLVGSYKSIDENSPELMPNAVMMEMDDGRLETLVEMREKVPVEKEVGKIFRTQSRTGVAIRLFEGKNEFDSQMRRINNLYVIKFDSPQPIGREFKIGYSVDRTKRINFVITFLDNGETYHINGQIKEVN